jgi:tetratricopeptide (TPR) repeat protein
MTHPQTQIHAHGPGEQQEAPNVWWAILVLVVITLLAYSNAAHDELVLDDKKFVGTESIVELEDTGEAFSRDIWDKNEVKSGLYRPMLLIFLDLETRLFGDWAIGYHLVNILTHLLACLLLFGFLLHLLHKLGGSGKTAMLAALLSAVVFAVHPAHTEVVNSIFNRSSIYVSICAILGLWWVSYWVDKRPVTAWLGLALFYSIGIFFKESALVIPGIAVALIFILSDKSFAERIRRFLPVFALLIPIAIFFYIRHLAFSTGVGDVGEVSAAGTAAGATPPEARLVPDLEIILAMITNLGLGLKVLLWPHPLQLFYQEPTGMEFWLLNSLQAGLLATAIYLFLKGKPGLAAGLAFYYIAMLPSSRVISLDHAVPHLAERYLYFPSVGLAITLAIALMNIMKRYGAQLPIMVGLPLILFMSFLTWERNHEWSDEYLLFKTEYDRGYRNQGAVRLIVGKLIEAKNFQGIIDICEENPEKQAWSIKFSNTCALSYLRLKRYEDAITAFELTARNKNHWVEASLAIGDILIETGKLQEGADRYAEVINRTDDPAPKEVLKGVLLLKLYPGNRQKTLEAKAYFDRALAIDPESEQAKAWIEHVDALLDPQS